MVRDELTEALRERAARLLRGHLNRREQRNDADQQCTDSRDHLGWTDVGAPANFSTRSHA